MKTVLRLLALAGAAAIAAPVVSAQSPGPRTERTINDGWRYADGPREGAEAPDHDDSEWDRVDLPHTWNAGADRAESPEYRRGVGWYRRALELDPSLRDRRLFLRFEGANQVADVFVNGESVGRHVGGYTAFAFDITDRVRFDAPNVIAVRVDNAHDPDIPPLDADFTFHGGIYRDVWLIDTDPVHVTLLDHASPGIFIDTPEVSEAEATVRVRGRLVNGTPEPRRVEVASRIVDPNGDLVTTLRTTVELPAEGETSFLQRSEPIRRPRLWSPAEPNLYAVITEVREDDRVRDRVRNPLGFRWFRIDPEEGFFLNGRALRLIGTNRHQDVAGYGNAVPDALHRRDVELVGATGFNFLRLAHYPQDPAVLEAMDRVGLVGWEEIPVVNMITPSEAFTAHAERMLVEMIRQHYNHPSILFWGYMNEVLLRRPDPMPEGYLDAVLALARRLEARVHAEDSTRATVTAISFDEIDNGSGFQDIPDVLGLNLYFGWYYRELEGLGPYLDSLHARNPARPLMISEYGAGSDERIHALESRAFDFSTEYQQRFHESHLRQLLDRPYLAGTAVWNQFDFASAGRNDSKPNINQKGLLYHDRTPKDIWHLHRARLLDRPVLHIATRDWPIRAGSRRDDARQVIVVYSNLPEAELVLNGTSLGNRTVVDGVARWTAVLAHGENRLVARGRAGDAEVRDEAILRYEDRSPLLLGRGGHSNAPGVPGRSPDVQVAPAAARSSDPQVAPASARSSDPRVGPPLAIAVNAGSHYQYVDRTETVWEADRAYEPGGWGYIDGEPRLDHARVRGTEEDGLFQATREGVTAYRFDVIDGEYEVRIALVDTRHRRRGERVFSVLVNGVAVFRDIDLAGGAGPNTAVERIVRVSAEGGNGVVVRFDATMGAATVGGVEVRRR